MARDGPSQVAIGNANGSESACVRHRYGGAADARSAPAADPLGALHDGEVATLCNTSIEGRAVVTLGEDEAMAPVSEGSPGQQRSIMEVERGQDIGRGQGPAAVPVPA